MGLPPVNEGTGGGSTESVLVFVGVHGVVVACGTAGEREDA
jgi:hypothetical protein